MNPFGKLVFKTICEHYIVRSPVFAAKDVRRRPGNIWNLKRKNNILRKRNGWKRETIVKTKRLPPTSFQIASLEQHQRFHCAGCEIVKLAVLQCFTTKLNETNYINKFNKLNIHFTIFKIFIFTVDLFSMGAFSIFCQVGAGWPQNLDQGGQR